MKRIIKFVKEEYGYDVPINNEHIIGHIEVNPIVRTKCPGEKFPMERIINDLKNGS